MIFVIDFHASVVEIKDDSVLVVPNVCELVARFSSFVHTSLLALTCPKSFMDQDESGRMEGQIEGQKSMGF